MKALPLKLFILIFCIFLFSFGAQNPNLEFKGDENFYFESAKAMLQTKDVVTPRYMGEERFQKPILFYWLILAAFKMFGINWFAARLPSIISGALLAYLVFAISNLLFKDIEIGLFAALFSATIPLCYRYARLAVPDMTLIFFITLALYYFLRFYKDRTERKSIKLFFLALALAVLIKGPIGLVIPLLIIGIFCLIKKEKLFGWGDVLTGLTIFVLIIGPWFYFMYKIHGETYVGHILSREILQRLGFGYSGSFLIRYFKGFYFYICALTIMFIPYSLFVPVAFINSFKISSSQFSNRYNICGKDQDGNAHLFLILWLVTVFLFFTFVAERRTHYLLALSPALSILVGTVFKSAISDKQFFLKVTFKALYIATIISIIFFACLFIFSDCIYGKNKIADWKFTLVIVPIILAVGFRYRHNSLMPLSLVFSLSILYSAMAISQPFGLFTNKMERAAIIIKSELKEGDRIGIGSHGIIPEELQVFFEIPVENVKVTYKRDGTPDFENTLQIMRFLNSNERIFCVIKRRDYGIFIPEETKKNLYILNQYYVWKRRIKFDNELLTDIKLYSFRDIFQNEIYIISNRR